MRETFRGYYRPTDEEFTELWKDCIFCFDANILLNIYRYTPKTREKFMRILKKVSNRIVIPYQAAEEYQNNRLKVIKGQKDAYENIINKIQNNFSQIETYLNKFKKHPLINVKDIIDTLSAAYASIGLDLEEKQENHPDLFVKDELRDEITDLLNGKISDPCPITQMNKVKEEVERRYKNKIPPGYKDYTKEENNWGDLILWFQILEIAKERKLPIIFVTDDKKEDWWWTFAGKTIGPRQELVEEMYNQAHVRFYMYKTDQFIEFAEKELFKKDADPEFIEEVKDVITKDKYVTTNDELDIVKMIPRSESEYMLDYKSGYMPLPPNRPYELEKIKNKLNDIENGESVSLLDLDKIENDLNSIIIKQMDYNKYKQQKLDNLQKEHSDKSYELELVNNHLKEDILDDAVLDYYLTKQINLKNEIKYLKQKVRKIRNEIYTSEKKLNSLNEQLYTIKRGEYNKYKRVQPLE